MAAANNAFRESIGVTELVTIEALDNLYANLTGSDPYRDCLVLERAGDMHGYARTGSVAESAGYQVEEVAVVLQPAIRDEPTFAALLA